MATTDASRGSESPVAVASGYMRALTAHDLDDALSYWAPGARQNVRGQVDTTAPDGVRAQMEELFAAVPDARFEVVATTLEGERCALQWRMIGTFDGGAPMQGVVPTGSTLELEGVDVFTVRDGLIWRNDAFSDTMEFARQVGMMPPRASRAERAMTAAFNGLTRVRRLFGHR
jgi:predicted ester cyclase